MDNDEKTLEELILDLEPKQKLFADFYVGEANLNATRAAILAKYSKKTASAIGAENLRKPKIKDYINKLLDEISMPSKEIIAGLTREAKGSIADILNEHGKFDYQEMIRRGTDKLIKKLKIKTTTRKEHGSKDEIEETIYELELYDAQAAKVHLGKMRGLFSDKIELTGANGKDLIPSDISLKIEKIWGDDAK